ncbi:MAG: helix-turn-helix transcriptional regulator, partial [Nocardioides sp.]
PTEERTRFRMLPPIRHRGITHLREGDELLDLRRRHRDWYLDLSIRTSENWMSREQVEHMDRLRRELGNVQTALEFCCSSAEEARVGLEMGAQTLEFGLADGVFRESRVWFDRLLARDTEPSDTRARALRTASWFAAMQGDLSRAAELLEEGRALAEEYGGRTGVLLTQTAAFVAMFSGELDAAAVQFEAALAGFTALGDTSQAAHTLALSALNHTFRQDYPAALDAHRDCLALTEPVGEWWYRSYSLWIAGLALWADGRADEGAALEKESLRLKRRTHDRLGIGTSVEALAWMGADRDPRHAARMLGAAQGIWDRIETSTEALAGLHVAHVGCVRTCVAALGEDAYAEAFEEGRRLDPAAAIDLALEEAAPVRAAAAKAVRRRSGGATGTLTPRERQIAALVATGMSNKDIASSLVISKRTAETHVEHILTKLGFTNRNQIAAWMMENASASAGDEP